MNRFYLFVHLCLLLLGMLAAEAEDGDFIDPLKATGFSGVTAYSTMLSNAPASLARSCIAGTRITKGIIGESIAAKSFLQTSLQKTGNWHSISPRIGPNGIDHIFLKIDPDTAIPRGIIVGESKYNKSPLGKTADGLQLTSRWTNTRLRAMGNRYYRLSNVTTIQKAPFLGGRHEMKVVLKEGKDVCFWRAGSKDPWKFSGTQAELQEAQKIAKIYGQYLSAAGEGKIIYRSRLFQIVPQGNDIVISVKDASQLDVLQRASKLPETQRIILPDVLKRKLSKDVELEIAKKLKGNFPNWSDRDLAKLAKNINSTAKNVLTPYGGMQMLRTFASHAGIASAIAIAIDAGAQYFITGQVDTKKLMLTGGSVFLGTISAQYLEVGLAQWSVSQSMFRSLANTLNCSTSLLGSAFSSATGAFFVGLLFSYGSWYMGYADIETANRMAIASSIGTGAGFLAGMGTIAAISAWGTASTGTAIATLSGAAATNASLAFLGGGSLAAEGFGMWVGGVVFGGVVAIVAIAGTVTVMVVYDVVDKKQDFARITKLCELLSQPDSIDLIMENSAIPGL